VSIGRLNFCVYNIESFELSLLWKEDNRPDSTYDPCKPVPNQPIDMTGWSGQLVADTLPGSPFSLTLGSDGTIYLLVLDVSSWPIGPHDYRIVLTDLGGVVDTILTGQICVKYIPPGTMP
jgi:hypothetical protein